jgi:hypothetical protein
MILLPQARHLLLERRDQRDEFLVCGQIRDLSSKIPAPKLSTPCLRFLRSYRLPELEAMPPPQHDNSDDPAVMAAARADEGRGEVAEE